VDTVREVAVDRLVTIVEGTGRATQAGPANSQ
jgi:hypothetical protein